MLVRDRKQQRAEAENGFLSEKRDALFSSSQSTLSSSFIELIMDADGACANAESLSSAMINY